MPQRRPAPASFPYAASVHVPVRDAPHRSRELAVELPAAVRLSRPAVAQASAASSPSLVAARASAASSPSPVAVGAPLGSSPAPGAARGVAGSSTAPGAVWGPAGSLAS